MCIKVERTHKTDKTLEDNYLSNFASYRLNLKKVTLCIQDKPFNTDMNPLKLKLRIGTLIYSIWSREELILFQTSVLKHIVWRPKNVCPNIYTVCTAQSQSSIRKNSSENVPSFRYSLNCKTVWCWLASRKQMCVQQPQLQNTTFRLKNRLLIHSVGVNKKNS